MYSQYRRFHPPIPANRTWYSRDNNNRGVYFCMSGFQVFNTAGNQIIDSNTKGTAFSTEIGFPALTDIGFFLINSQFGNGSTLGILSQTFPLDAGLTWFRFNRGSYCMPGALLFEANSGQFMRTTASGQLQSGYLDVFDGGGRLVWSAASAGTMPRIVDFIDVPAGFNLQDTLITKPMGFNPWICISQMPANVSFDGTAGGYSGFQVRWTGNSVQLTYISRAQNTFSYSVGTGGFRVALATFTGY